MATRCPLCGKKPMTANKRKLLCGHYNPVNRYRKYPNLQWSAVDNPKEGEAKRILICASCIKTKSKSPRIKKSKAVAKATQPAKTA